MSEPPRESVARGARRADRAPRRPDEQGSAASCRRSSGPSRTRASASATPARCRSPTRRSQARAEAVRCLSCKNEPCVSGCPVGVDVPGFLRLVADGDFRGAIRRIKETNLLPAICGRVCPQESQCQENCMVAKVHKDLGFAVSVGKIEAFLADWEREEGGVELPSVGAPTGPPRRDHRRRPVGSRVRRRPAPLRPRGRRLRGLPQGGRRPRLRHPRVPPAQGDRPGRGRQPRADGRAVRVRHDRRPDVHARRALRRGLRRRLRRDGRGPPLLRQHPGRGR